MPSVSNPQRRACHYVVTLWRVLVDVGHLVLLLMRSSRALAAENLFLRKQLAMFQERQLKPHRANDSSRWVMAALSRWFDWRDALVVVKPDTLIRWHRKGFGLFWRHKSRPVGRPRLPEVVQQLIRTMAAENLTWGEERITNELQLKLGIRLASSTVRKYMSRRNRPAQDPNQRWLTPAVVDLYSQPRRDDRRQRFLHGSHGPVPYPLCIGRHGARSPPDSALRGDGSSHGRVDLAAIPSGTAGQPPVSFRHS